MKRQAIIPLITQNTFESLPPGALRIKLLNNNWHHSYPYTPFVEVSLWHDGTTLFLFFEVEEEYIAALVQKDNDKVSKDSCVELFISFDRESYYNIEANCVGKVLMSNRKGRKIDVKYATIDVLNKIHRVSSLGSDPFTSRKSEGRWSLFLSIPSSVFFQHNLKNFSGMSACCNIYKCGDDLPQPHYLSWQPISTDSPDFHRPEFFGDIFFE